MLSSRRLAAACVMILTLGATACGGSDVADPPAKVPGTLTVSVAPASATVEAGSSTSATVSIVRGGSFAGTASLTVEGAPAGVTASLGSTSLAAGVTSGTLTISVAASVAAGTYPLTVRATGSGVTAAVSTLTLTVTVPATPDFSVAVTPGTLTIQQGDSATAAIAVTRVGGFTGEVGLFVSGAPTDVRALATPNSTTGNNSALSVSVAVNVAPGTYPLVLTASENGPRTRTATVSLIVTAKPSAGALTLSPSSITVTQTVPSEAIVVRLARPAGVTGPIALALEKLPIGFSGTFTPNPVTGDSALLVLSLSQLAPTGSNTIRVRATVGNATSTADLLVTSRTFVPPNFNLSVVPAVAAVTAGSAASFAIAINRTNFTDPVTLAVTGLPLGLTASVTPAAAPGDSATLDLTVASTVAPGVYPLVVSGSAAGISGTRSTTLSLTINAPTSGGNVQWQFCAPSRFPLWFGVRSGTSGAWTQVSATANATGQSFAFPFDQAGQLAYVNNTSDGVAITVFNTTPQEVLAQAASECANNRPTKTISGRFINGINNLRGASISAGGANVVVPAGGSNFTLTGVKEGVTDIIAYLGIPNATGWSQFDRIIMRRDIDPADGATLDDFDFSGTEWLFSVGANFLVRNFNGEMFTSVRSYITGNGNIGAPAAYAPASDSIIGLYGVPEALRRPGDLHQAIFTTVNATAPRSVTSYNTNFNSPPVVFGSTLAAPTISVTASMPVRVRAEGAWSTEYGSAVAATFTQQAGAPNARSVVMSASRAFFGAGGSYLLETPDFAGAPGFNATWLLRSGVSTTHTVTATGIGVGASLTPADGTQIISGSRIGSVTP